MHIVKPVKTLARATLSLLLLCGCERRMEPPRFAQQSDPRAYLQAASIAEGPFAPLSAATRRRLDSLMTRASELAGGDVSLAAVHVESGERYLFDAGRGVFVGESIKLPVMLSLLGQVDASAIRLRDSVVLMPADLRPSWMTPRRTRTGGSISLSRMGPTAIPLERLLFAAADSGDLTALDALLAVSGGPGRVNRDLASLAVRGMRVDRSMGDQILDYVAAEPRPPIATENESSLRHRWQSMAPDLRRDADLRFHADERDRATAEALATVLVRVARGELLSDSTRALLVTLFRMPSSTQAWLTAALPDNATYLHFGTSWRSPLSVGAANEFAIVMLPGGRGRLALAVTAANTTSDSVPEAFHLAAKAAYSAFALR